MRLLSKTYIAYQILDLVTTYIGINYLGMVEQNPLPYLMGWKMATILKVLIVTMIVLVMESDYLLGRFPRYRYIASVILNIEIAVPVFLNAVQFLL